MVALGEMTTIFPVSGAFTVCGPPVEINKGRNTPDESPRSAFLRPQHYAARFVDPALGFALGWNYWYSYAITLPTEITAAALVINYWTGAQGKFKSFLGQLAYQACSY